MQYYMHGSLNYHGYTQPSDTIFSTPRATAESQNVLIKFDT